MSGAASSDALVPGAVDTSKIAASQELISTLTRDDASLAVQTLAELISRANDSRLAFTNRFGVV